MTKLAIIIVALIADELAESACALVKCGAGVPALPRPGRGDAIKDLIASRRGPI